MEAHHPHHIGHKKKWFEFLLEFFMLFLAVFLGFIAENKREHVIENNREENFINSLSVDLNNDIQQLSTIITSRRVKDSMMKSLLVLLNNGQANANGKDVYYNARWLPRTYRFFSNDRTLLQLKNAGNWRLIRNKKVSAALQLYDQQVRTITAFIEHREELLVELIYPSLHKLFDNQVFESMVDGLSFRKPTNNPQLMTNDREAINIFCNQIHFLRNSNVYFIENAETLLKAANKTLGLLKNEYHL